MLFRLTFLLFILLPVVFGLNGKQLVDYVVKQYSKLGKTLKIGFQYPSDGDPMSAKWHTGVTNGWTAGFYPGILWHLYKFTNNEEWKRFAIEATDGLFEDQFLTNTHDIGFMIMCSYGNGYELTKNASYAKIIANAAHHLATRFNPTIGCTRSWSHSGHKEFSVIVDNMMNLELLFKGWQITGNKTLYDMAISHTNTTIKEHLRKDYSSYHVVTFNETNGKVIRKYTAQGYADWSCWSRGQSWLINGFTTTYKYTKMPHILEAAENVSNYYIDNLPEDGIPYWDFNVPLDIYPYIPRDSSSAAIAASGLFELYEHTKNEKYSKVANYIMDSLSSDKYRADGRSEYKLPALLVNGTIAGPNAAKRKSDLALIYGDYYFTKAIHYLLK